MTITYGSVTKDLFFCHHFDVKHWSSYTSIHWHSLFKRKKCIFANGTSTDLGKIEFGEKNWIHFVSLSTFPCFRFCTDRLMIWFALKPGGLLVSICCVYCSVSSEKHCIAVQASVPLRENSLRYQKCSRRENLLLQYLQCETYQQLEPLEGSCLYSPKLNALNFY